MTKKIIAIILVYSSVFNPLAIIPAFAKDPSAEYLCEFGRYFFHMGRYDEALVEFNKALSIEPGNRTAREYINDIFKQEKENSRKMALREEKVKEALDSYGGKNKLEARLNKAEEKDQQKDEAVKISGTLQSSLGMASGETIWKRANFDLNERNWRMISNAAYNKRINTYDPRVFDSVSVDLSTDNKEGFNFHSNITVDPWSFTGKTEKRTITGNGGAPAEIELKYWANTGYTLNETVYASGNADTFTTPEMKVEDGRISSTSIRSSWLNTFNIPALKIQREFQPLRELWFDYKQEPVDFRVFPLAFQDQVSASDDPLRISNHHIWWENSMWLRRYHPGIYNSTAGPPRDFRQGWWDNSLAALRYSSGMYITALRGFSFNLQPAEATSFSTTVATPKHLWQNYEDIDNVISASRFKHYLMDNFSLGATVTSRVGFNVDQGSKVDNKNYVGGIDSNYEFRDGLMGSAEILTSRSYNDLTNADYNSKSRGNTYYFSLISRYPEKSIIDLTYGYDEIRLDKEEPFLFKARFFGAHMDSAFDSALSSYRNTRSDTLWSRHISFRRSFDYYQQGIFSSPGQNWDELNATRIGDGIDTGRDVLGFRLEAITDKGNAELFDLRNVHSAEGKFIENVARNETTFKAGDKLTVKTLGIYQRLPKTQTGVDPFIIDNQTGGFVSDWSSDPIDGGKDPTLKTGSIGAEYCFFDWLSANTAWEYTNDYNLAYGNYPRSILITAEPSRIYYDEGRRYRGDLNNVYDQFLFPQPPYDFYNIYKLGLRVFPIEKLDLYLDHTRNEFEIAGQNTDNMNHTALELTYLPMDKLGLALKYTYSRWRDLDRIRAGPNKAIGHHNFFSEIKYFASKDDEFSLQYGEGNTSPVGNITYDPNGGSLLSIDTQQIWRLYYRRKF